MPALSCEERRLHQYFNYSPYQMRPLHTCFRNMLLWITSPLMIAKWVMKTMCSNYILNTVAAEYSQQAFTHVFGIFQRMCSIQVTKSAWWWEIVACIKQNTTITPLCIWPMPYLCSIKEIKSSQPWMIWMSEPTDNGWKNAFVGIFVCAGEMPEIDIERKTPLKLGHGRGFTSSFIM